MIPNGQLVEALPAIQCQEFVIGSRSNLPSELRRKVKDGPVTGREDALRRSGHELPRFCIQRQHPQA